jgi:arsenate reductase
MVRIYGIKNCDTMKKASKWLEIHNIQYEFHDYKKSGIDADRLRVWEAQLGWETLLNRRGIMWRRMSDEVKAAIDRESALHLHQTPAAGYRHCPLPGVRTRTLRRNLQIMEDGLCSPTQ